MLRAAYFGQELLSTFGNSIGEIALIPATGGLFTVHLTYKPAASSAEVQQVLLWDRKAEGGFPETKILKQRVRNHIEPEKNLGHSDTPAKAKAGTEKSAIEASAAKPAKESEHAATESSEGAPSGASKDCEDCK